MTTTLRPTEPLQHGADGVRSRRYEVCVNGRPVGTLHLATHPLFGPRAALITELRIDERERGRGRGTVAALAAEEVARTWGCRRIEASVPAAHQDLLRLATTLGYLERNRTMAKSLEAAPRPLPGGTAGRRMTEAEFTAWRARAKETYVHTWTERGIPEGEARAKADRDHAALLPEGLATPDVLLSVLEHDGEPVGTLWLALRDDGAYVYDVEVTAERRGRGHGRALMLLAEADALAVGADRIGLNVFADNKAALSLYTSLGYQPVQHHLYKTLL
ncbi:GNAT family N-acetyltransferase [Streptomyces beihaiensis]|uniref:GNAT family N-acetyltransferase n=1 Tax=Streptomyces beihaiensis TaxID=2984495 RepID=A0ABT3TPY1_9ACTN|nr:GNAT family N-acetyltransferase [Streptomyces beihaiensis]MCX3059066.1 GNAT family N-acetyltransferase [Streptomyces beihaiensis]